MNNSEITINSLSLAVMIASTSFDDNLINSLITFNWLLALSTQVVFPHNEKRQKRKEFCSMAYKKLTEAKIFLATYEPFSNNENSVATSS